MAKLTTEEQAALEKGHYIASLYFRAVIPSCSRNPYLWSSRLWEAWEFGDYLAEKGIPLGEASNWQRGRGNSFRNQSGQSFKLWYSTSRKGSGQSFGIKREG